MGIWRSSSGLDALRPKRMTCSRILDPGCVDLLATSVNRDSSLALFSWHLLANLSWHTLATLPWHAAAALLRHIGTLLPWHCLATLSWHSLALLARNRGALLPLHLAGNTLAVLSWDALARFSWDRVALLSWDVCANLARNIGALLAWDIVSHRVALLSGGGGRLSKRHHINLHLIIINILTWGRSGTGF